MASKTTLLKYVNEQILECIICMDTFNNPKALPCLHVFCAACIGKHIDTNTKGGKYACPTCNETHTTAKAGKEQLRDAFLQKSLLEVASLTKRDPMPCSSCAGNKEAEVACPTCGQYFCADCRASHASIPLTRSHPIYPIAELADATKLANFQARRYTLCARHQGESCKLFCNHPTCMKEICQVCTHEKSHESQGKKHPVVSVDEKLDEYKQNIDGKLPLVRENLTELSKQKKMLEGIQAGVKQHENAATQNLDRRSREVSDMVQRHKTDITRKMKTESDEQQGKVKVILKSVDTEMKKFEKLAGLGDHLNKIPVSSALQVARDFIAESEKLKPVDPIQEDFVKAQSPGLHFKAATLDFNGIEPTFASMVGVFPPPFKKNSDITETNTNMPIDMATSLTQTIKETVWENRDKARNPDQAYKLLTERINAHMTTKNGGSWNCVVATANQVYLGRMDTKGSYWTGIIEGQYIEVYDAPRFWWDHWREWDDKLIVISWFFFAFIILQVCRSMATTD